MYSVLRSAVALATLGFMVGGAAEVGRCATLTFSGLAHGEILSNQFAPFVTISAVNPNRSHDLAIVFDSTETGTSDPDLEGPPWAAGNLAASATVLGNLAIIAEKDVDVGNDGIIDDPDDERMRPAGSITLDFTASGQLFDTFGFDILDIEGVLDEQTTIDFFNDAAPVGTIDLTAFTTPGPTFDPTVVFGNNSANRIGPHTTTELGLSGDFNKVTFNLGGSSAIDNIFVVPEPTITAFAVSTLIALALLCRKGRSF